MDDGRQAGAKGRNRGPGGTPPVYSFQLIPQPDVGAVLPKPGRTPNRTGSLPVQSRSVSFSSHAVPGSDTVAAGGPPPQGGMSPAPSPCSSPCPPIGPGGGFGAHASRRDPQNAGDLSYRSVDSDLAEHSELNFYRNTRILHPWDLASDHGRPLSVPSITANGSGSFGLTISNSYVHAGTSAAQRELRVGRTGHNAATSSAYLAAARRPSTEDGYAVPSNPAPAPSYQSRPPQVPRLMLHGLNGSPGPPGPAAVKEASSGQGNARLMANGSQPQAEGSSALGGSGGVEGLGAGTGAPAPAQAPQRRSFELEPIPGGAAAYNIDHSQGTQGGAIAAGGMGGVRAGAAAPAGDQPWVGRAETPTGEAAQEQVYGGGIEGAVSAASAAAAFGRPATTPLRAGGLIPQPSSLYGPASAYLAKLPLPRTSPRRSPRNSPRVMSVAPGPSGGAQQGQAQNPILAPHSQATAAAATATAAAAGGQLHRTVSDGPRPYTAPLSIMASPRTTTESAPEQTPGSSLAASVAWATQSGSSSPALPGTGDGASQALRSGAGSGDGATAAANDGGGASPRAAPVTPTSAILEQQRAGQAVTIEQILMGTNAAPARGFTPAVPRLDAQSTQQVQQAFRSLNPKAKPPTREDVFELQAALFRQISLLLPEGAASAGAVAVPLTSALSAQPSQGAVSAPAIAFGSSMRHTSPGSQRPGQPVGTNTPSQGSNVQRHGSLGAATPAPSMGVRSHTVDGAGPISPRSHVAGPPPAAAPFSWEDVAFQPLLPRDADGFINEDAVLKQEHALTWAVSGIVAQVGVSCVARAHLLHGVWATVRQLFAAVLHDRESARAQLQLARRNAAAAASSAATEIETLRQSLTRANQNIERLTARERETLSELATSKYELAKMRKAVTESEVESLAAQLAALQESHAAAQAELETLRSHLQEMEQDLADARQDTAMAAARAATLEAQSQALASEVRARTPRPKRSLGAVGELLDSAQQAAVLAALAAGAPPAEVHRLLLGLTAEGEDIRPWAASCGCARGVVPPWSDPASHAAATAPPPDAAAGAVAALLNGLPPTGASRASNARISKSRPTSPGGGGNGGVGAAAAAADGKSRPSSPTSVAGAGAAAGVSASSLSLLRRGVSFQKKGQLPGQPPGGAGPGTAASGGGGGPIANGQLPPGADPLAPSLSTPGAPAVSACPSPREGSSPARPHRTSIAGAVVVPPSHGLLGAGAASAAARRQSIAPAAQQAYARRLHTWLEDLIEGGDVPLLQRLLPDEAVDVIGAGLQLGVSPSAIAAWLLGSLAPAGFNYAPFKELTGVLANRFGHTGSDLGGPVTQGLELAALSTVQRVRTLEERGQELHREVVKLKRSLADLRRAERARALAEAEAKERKNLARHERPTHPVQAFIDSKWADFFVGLGSGANIPRVLRAEGRIFNRRLEKVEAERMVNAIWEAKDEWQAKNKGAHMTLGEFLVGYMQRKYVAPRAITETAYNLVYTLGQHCYDPDCNLFIKVLLGEVDEGVREEQEELQNDIVNMLACVDSAVHGRATGYLSKRDMRVALKGFFSSKKGSRLEEVLEALDTDCPGETVQYRRLFDDDGDLNQGVFAETIRTQHLAERLEQLQTIEDALLDAAERAHVRYVAPSLLAGVLKATLPDCSDDTFRHYNRIVFGLDARVRAAEAAAAAANGPPARASGFAAAAKGAAASTASATPTAAAAAAVAAGALGPAPSGSTVAYQQGSGGMPGTRTGSVPSLPLAAVLATGGANGTSGPPGDAASVASGATSIREGSEEQPLLLSPEQVMALIRRGWVPHVPSISSAVASLSVAAKLKARLHEAIQRCSTSPDQAKKPAKKGWSAAISLARGLSSAAMAFTAAGAAASGRDSPASGSTSGEAAGRGQRAAAKRLRYLTAMDAVRDTWLQEEKARVAQLVSMAAAPLGSNASSPAPPDGPESGAKAPAAQPRSAPQLPALPTAQEFADDDDPELAALEAAQKLLAAQVTLAAVAAAAATSGGADGKGSGGAMAAGSPAVGRSHVSFVGGPEGTTPRTRRVSMNPGGVPYSSASATVEEAGDRMAQLRALDGLMVALVEDRPEAPAAALDPEIRRNLYRDPSDSGDGDSGNDSRKGRADESSSED